MHNNKNIKLYICNIIAIIFFIYFSSINLSYSNIDDDFNKWLSSYKQYALNKGISKNTVDVTFKDVKYLKNVIKYDRRQPEFIGTSGQLHPLLRVLYWMHSKIDYELLNQVNERNEPR